MICGLRYYRLDEISEGLVEVFCFDGVSYQLKVPVNAELNVTRTLDDSITLLTSNYIPVYHHITEQGQTLYGFADRVDRNLFVDLISVDGVGPTMALKIMSFYPSEKIRIDIADGDVEDFCKAKGVGKKSAEKIISDLRSKYAKYSSKKEASKEDYGADMSGLMAAITLAEKALIKLSFPVKEAKERVNNAMKQINADQMKEGKFGERPCEEIVPELVRMALTN